MDVKEAAVEYLPEIAPQTYEDDVPPGYKRTEVGVIPEDWGVSELGSLFKIASSKRVMQAQWRASGIPFYRTREIAALSECGRVQNDLFISEKLYREYATKYGAPEKGDILVTGIGTIGLAYVVDDDENFYFKDASVIWLKNNGSYDANFLNQLYKTSVIKDQINNSSTGTTVATYTIAGAQKTLVPAPSKTEQRAIATALSDADALIAALQRLIAKKRAIKQGAMQALLTGRQRLPGFTGKWETKPLGDVTHIKTGSRNNQDNVSTGAYPFFVRSEHVERINSYAYDCEAILVPGEGKIGEIFHYISGRFDVHQRVYAITQFATDVCGKFIYFYMKQHFGAHALQNTVKATVDSLRLPTFQNFEMHVPPTRNEQTAIATVLADMDAEIEALEARLAKTRALKAGMMQQLLTGRIRLPLEDAA